MHGVPLCQAVWCCSFLCMYRRKWEVTESVTVKIILQYSGYYSEDYTRFALYCCAHLQAGIAHCTSGWLILESAQSTKTARVPNKL